MNCRAARERLSSYLDRDLEGTTSQALAAHLEACAACQARWRTLRVAIDALQELPRVGAAEPIAARILDRLEVESRGPGLALLFRPSWAARPLILPSLLPAALVLLALLLGLLAVGRRPQALVADGRVHGEAWGAREPLAGTEGNPLFPSAEVALPRPRPGHALPERLLADMGEGTLFLETVVARDGRVSTVTLLEGDSEQARPLVEALRLSRFEPVRVRGRAVAVSVYRLISRQDVRSAKAPPHS